MRDAVTRDQHADQLARQFQRCGERPLDGHTGIDLAAREGDLGQHLQSCTLLNQRGEQTFAFALAQCLKVDLGRLGGQQDCRAKLWRHMIAAVSVYTGRREFEALGEYAHGDAVDQAEFNHRPIFVYTNSTRRTQTPTPKSKCQTVLHAPSMQHACDMHIQ